MGKVEKLKYTWLYADTELPKELKISPEKLIEYAGLYIRQKEKETYDKLMKAYEEHDVDAKYYNRDLKFWEGQLKIIEKMEKENE